MQSDNKDVDQTGSRLIVDCISPFFPSLVLIQSVTKLLRATLVLPDYLLNGNRISLLGLGNERVRQWGNKGVLLACNDDMSDSPLPFLRDSPQVSDNIDTGQRALS